VAGVRWIVQRVRRRSNPVCATAARKWSLTSRLNLISVVHGHECLATAWRTAP
jgi:hypothetical protein